VLVSGLMAQSAQEPSEWTTAGYDLQRTGWNRGEQALSPQNVGGMRRLWKTVLPNTPHVLDRRARLAGRLRHGREARGARRLVVPKRADGGTAD
jgi:hypothetical protein